VFHGSETSTIQFDDVSSVSNIAFVTRNSATPNKNQIEAVVAGVALLVSGVLRLTLPTVRLGALVVRSRAIDTLTLVVAGGLLIGLAATFPTG